MRAKIEYKGFELGRREISQADFELAGLEFSKDAQIPTLTFEAGDQRRPFYLDTESEKNPMVASDIELIVEDLKRDVEFTVTVDGEVTQVAHADAATILADGSNKATGLGGSEALRESIGMEKPEGTANQVATGEDGSTDRTGATTEDAGTKASGTTGGSDSGTSGTTASGTGSTTTGSRGSR